MKKAIPYLVLPVVFSVFSCTKKAVGPTNEFLLNATPDHAYTQVVKAATALGLEIDRSDPSSLSMVTKPKEFTTGELFQSATFEEEDRTRFVRGRYSYNVTIMDQSGQAKIIIQPTIEGLFSGKQHGLEGSGGTNWIPGKSNGKLEQALFDQATKSG